MSCQGCHFISCIVLVHSTANGVQTPLSREMQRTPLCASIGSKSLLTYYTPTSNRSSTPTLDNPNTTMDVNMEIVPLRQPSPQPYWDTNICMENCALPVRTNPPPMMPRLHVDPPATNQGNAHTGPFSHPFGGENVLGKWPSRWYGNMNSPTPATR